MKSHIEILRAIIDYHSHTVDITTARDAITGLREKIENAENDFNFDFDGIEYRIIADSAIWDIYVEEIKRIVEDCYELNLDKIPDFIAVNIDWEKTAENAFADGYGHTFSSYDHSKIDVANYWIFRVS